MLKNSMLFLLLVLVLSLTLAPLLYLNEGFNEGFNNFGIYPESVETPILNDYPLIDRDSVTKNSSSTIWKYYPTFPVGSYEQITNNLRYRKNPDDGKCSRTEFCGTLYHNKDVKTNIIYPLPPAEEGKGARIGYYRTEPNYLYYSIPTNENILY
jgi:hypothetical protein